MTKQIDKLVHNYTLNTNNKTHFLKVLKFVIPSDR
jgi:hypothetical protein